MAILREQAALLGPKTNQLVKADVSTQGSGGTFVHQFFLLVPPLDNYRYELFKVVHSVALYPATFQMGGRTTAAQDHDEFRNQLRQILGSDQVKRLVNALLAQIER